MTNTIKPNARTEALVSMLTELKDRSQIVDFSTESVGNKRVWNVTLADDTADVIGDFHAIGMSTPEAEAFAAGIKYGSKRRPVGRAVKDNPYRTSIIEDGRVEVALGDADAAEQKRLRTAIFNAAYSLGLKGKFKVHTDPDANVLIGEVTDKRSLRGKKATTTTTKAAA